MLLHDYLTSQARTRPQEVALIVGSEYVTYESLDRSSTNLACALKKRGVARADRVALFLPNSKETVLGIFAALKADAAFVPLNPTVKFEKLTAILNDCRPTALITGNIRHIDPTSLAEGVPSLKVVVICDTEKPPSEERFLFLHDALEQGSGAQLSSQNIDIDLACVIYTSGSTGIPKGVMMAHRNVLSAANSIISYLDNTTDEIILSCLPLSFVYGLYQVLMSAMFGGTVVLERGFSYPQVIIEKLKEFKATGFPLVPTMAVMLLEMEAFNGRNLPDLRYITSAGAQLPVKYIKKMQTLFPHTRIYPMYGLTECARVSYLPPEQIALCPSSVGKGMANEEVWVVDETGSPVPPGETGELVVRGSNVMLGYWERPEETTKVLRQGRYPGERVLYTGDLFRSDNEGYLYFVGRKDDMIKTRGERVSPAEIERTLLKMASVKEVAVISVPDLLLDQTIVAHVVPTSNAKIDAQSVKKFAAEHLEDCMVPKFVEIVSNLPQNSSGKIDKRLLKDEFLSKRPIGKDVEGP